jgi:hypothetical protein
LIVDLFTAVGDAYDSNPEQMSTQSKYFND